ncbi:hypothetical protein CFK37_17975 [Virgibacillus phasianinus]|uniref:Lipoprotein n=1 Tax=Virgibacillus phasianinus TaxID=2017483 RepID=A0A220U705_9BACI|nr:hypothetical protein [Virgibacillus phasianinus]ASK63909.1 hypothetical protein CFK37_17975 [Virgibacillus phasianinus]
MKRLLLLFVLLLLVVSGCTDKNIQFSGESEHWKGQYNAVIGDTREDGEYTFKYKKATEDTVIENLKIVINDGETVLNGKRHKGAIVKVSSACSGCAVTNPEASIQVVIEWGKGKEEAFPLDPN